MLEMKRANERFRFQTNKIGVAQNHIEDDHNHETDELLKEAANKNKSRNQKLERRMSARTIKPKKWNIEDE